MTRLDPIQAPDAVSPAARIIISDLIVSYRLECRVIIPAWW